MNPILVEVIGFVGTIAILFSMLFKTTTLKGDIRMRVLNLIGSTIFTIYGFLLPAISTIVLNAILIIINIYHLTSLIKDLKKHSNDNTQQ